MFHLRYERSLAARVLRFLDTIHTNFVNLTLRPCNQASRYRAIGFHPTDFVAYTLTANKVCIQDLTTQSWSETSIHYTISDKSFLEIVAHPREPYVVVVGMKDHLLKLYLLRSLTLEFVCQTVVRIGAQSPYSRPCLIANPEKAEVVVGFATGYAYFSFPSLNLERFVQTPGCIKAVSISKTGQCLTVDHQGRVLVNGKQIISLSSNQSFCVYGRQINFCNSNHSLFTITSNKGSYIYNLSEEEKEYRLSHYLLDKTTKAHQICLHPSLPLLAVDRSNEKLINIEILCARTGHSMQSIHMYHQSLIIGNIRFHPKLPILAVFRHGFFISSTPTFHIFNLNRVKKDAQLRACNP